MKQIISGGAPKAVGPYSQAVVSNGFVFCSGQIALDLDGNIVGGDIVEQTRQVLKNLGAVLESAGSSFDRVVKTTVYLVNIADFSKFNEIYSEYFVAEVKPARATVAVKELPKGAMVEVECVAEI